MKMELDKIICSRSSMNNQCRKNECLPYVMRDVACWDCDIKDFLIDYAAYCNQPAMFKKLTFEEFLPKRHKNQNRIDSSLGVYHNAIL